MISQKLPELIQSSLKARDEIRLSTLKMLKSALSYAQIEAQHELSEAEELKVIQSEAKKRQDSIQAYENANRQELVDKETQELKILHEFLPSQLSDQELEQLINQVISEQNAKSIADLGKVIGAVLQKVQGKADGSRVSALVKQKLPQ